ncbi:hypothetical protein C8T65DRAFT_740960 [Cerioporus squamosus]|nr:hypothetical protein C8T65DRAFT_740960 [Cerioporus squamosus]
MFAHLALSVPNTTIVVPNLPLSDPTSSGSPGTGLPGSSGDDGGESNGSSHVGAIVGGVLGGVALVAATGAGTFFWCRRRGSLRHSSSCSYKQEEPMEFVLPYPHPDGYQDNQTPAFRILGSSKMARERARFMQQGEPAFPSEIRVTDPPTSGFGCGELTPEHVPRGTEVGGGAPAAADAGNARGEAAASARVQST